MNFDSNADTPNGNNSDSYDNLTTQFVPTEDTPPQPEFSPTYFNDMENHRKSIPLAMPSPKLLTEIELMSILNQHKCPQIVRKQITEWISKVHSTRPGFDFSQFKYRKPQVIMKEIASDPSLSLIQKSRIQVYNHKINQGVI
mmetsp:Transcript_15922/g.32635  ORF Transcript_15922/g.32635 Transcript_15922/m.32635 type:complete len:142 (-) Transcript_15922:203-628(-)|eukprot:CAMPEP_0201132800 /NCGR_PEP_ID=MMETSP0850-20130426/46874_1 /ASSEMBLY_ACC=CAM_ASM_000622 /TAXON_ID=183588 /ORGANISM="Pseudo-nitzschia fraudulenta, Strain WWA7" /LENGTH=141 /DNA_ID=CAMNT_0047403243 /DNA_START=123 /DNA_END=548 /DNA_ORIENTATION=+